MATQTFAAAGHTDESLDAEQVIVGATDVITRPETFTGAVPVSALMVCGRVTASAKLIRSVSTAVDGSQNPCAISIGPVTGVGDKVRPAYIAGEFNIDALVWHASWTNDAQKMAAFGNGPIVPRLLRDEVPSVTVDEDVVLDGTDRTVLVDATDDDLVVSLPSAASAFNGQVGHIYTVTKIDSSANTVTLDGDGAETIGGEATHELATQFASVTIQSDGTGWVVL